ncbi:GNAT family N-acetyltransferase [Thermopolyspora sp. NPDC052614]|uniref:GNAT family N-acetyltransferase n=1 Tax=Thermopolyspora sp. NPDC052614 TaxID=3155682 RepID=UPI0034311742
MRVRTATIDDIPELVRLREVLAARMSADANGYPAVAGWQDSYARSLRERLGAPDVAVFVIDRPEGGGLAACGMGFIYERFPGPVLLDGRFGYVLGMATDPEFRRRGYGRAIMEALLGWYRDNGVRRVDLHATSDGEPLYREYGFTARYPGLTWVDPSP